MTDAQATNQEYAAVLSFLKTAGLTVDDTITSLSGQIIPRDVLVSVDKYEECRPKLAILKEWLSSSRLSCLQSTAEDNQKWPLLNAVRQLLRRQGFKMTPFRMSDGYTKDGKKKLRRFFIVESMRQAGHIKAEPLENSNGDDGVGDDGVGGGEVGSEVGVDNIPKEYSDIL